MRRAVSRVFAPAIAVSFLAASCMSGTECIVADVSPAGWSEPVELRYSNTDTLSLRNLQLTLRHSALHESPGGRYIVETVSPSEIVTTDTMNIRVLLATQGNKLQEAWSSPVDVLFDEAGDWRFTVTPLRNTIGVWSVGIEINNRKQ